MSVFHPEEGLLRQCQTEHMVSASANLQVGLGRTYIASVPAATYFLEHASTEMYSSSSADTHLTLVLRVIVPCYFFAQLSSQSSFQECVFQH
jgi:hypothetical protein